jgi:hypothetical protein
MDLPTVVSLQSDVVFFLFLVKNVYLDELVETLLRIISVLYVMAGL